MRRALEFRAPINLGLAAAIGVVGLHQWPFPSGNAFLAVIDARKPWLFDGLAYLYATLWFSTPLIGLTVISALLYVAVMRIEKRVGYGPLPAYPEPSARQEPFLVLGEQHHPTQPMRLAHPTWLTIPRKDTMRSCGTRDAAETTCRPAGSSSSLLALAWPARISYTFRTIPSWTWRRFRRSRSAANFAKR